MIVAVVLLGLAHLLVLGSALFLIADELRQLRAQLVDAAVSQRLGRSLQLSADRVVELAAHVGAVDPGTRTISGLIVSWAGTGRTSAGEVRFARGSLRYTDPRRVKLLREHDRQTVLGYATELRETDLGIEATFYVPPGVDGDRALAEARDGLRDGLSVGAELIDVERDGDLLMVRAAALREVSQVSVPAFDDARIASVAASAAASVTARGAAVPCTSCNQHHAPGTPCATVQASGQQPQAQQTGSTAVLPGTGQLQVTQHRVVEAGGQQYQLVPVPRAVTATPEAPPAAAQAPGHEPRRLDLAAFCQLFAENVTGQGDPQMLRAALTDIIPGNTSTAFFQPAYLTELWDENADVERPLIDSIRRRPLPRALQVIGHRWVTKPTVGDYAGDKAEVPSTAASMEAVPVNVERTAGANDIDRAYLDLGSPDFLAAYFSAMVESYRERTEDKVADYVLANVTSIADANGVTAGTSPTLLDGVLAAVIEMSMFRKRPTFVAIGSELVSELFGVSAMEAPAYYGGQFQLAAGGNGELGGLRFFVEPGWTRQFVVGSQRAVTFWEADPPIRVQTIDVANGGVDAGVFGYHAQFVTDRRAIRRGEVQPAA